MQKEILEELSVRFDAEIRRIIEEESARNLKSDELQTAIDKRIIALQSEIQTLYEKALAQIQDSRKSVPEEILTPILKLVKKKNP